PPDRGGKEHRLGGAADVALSARGGRDHAWLSRAGDEAGAMSRESRPDSPKSFQSSGDRKGLPPGRVNPSAWRNCTITLFPVQKGLEGSQGCDPHRPAKQGRWPSGEVESAKGKALS